MSSSPLFGSRDYGTARWVWGVGAATRMEFGRGPSTAWGRAISGFQGRHASKKYGSGGYWDYFSK